jgi:signal transduction histidine kinase
VDAANPIAASSPGQPRFSLARLSVARKGLILVAVPLLFHLLFVITVAEVEREHREQRAGSLRSRHTIAAAYKLLGLMVDAETGMRGYVLTRNEIFLDPYRAAVAELPRQFDELRVLDGAGAGVTHFHGLTSTAQGALEYQSSIIAELETGDVADVITSITRLDGKQRMDAFRAAMQNFLAEEERQSRAAAARSDAAQFRLYAALTGGFIADVLLAGMLSIFFTRSIAARLSAVNENTLRVERHEPLAPTLQPGDEIAALDARLHEMASSIDAAQRGMEEANRELAAFSYSISHDLRAPVRAVDGYARMLQEDYGERLTGDGTRFVNTIRSEARRMGRLIDDLLAFAKLGRADAQEAEIDMTGLAKEVVEQLRREQPETAAEFHVGELLPAHGDRAMLRQVFINFLSNAMKFSAHAEKPSVEAGSEQRDGENVYWVRDNGVGFDMRYAAKLFGVFQRLHRFDEFEGTGVGLAIVKRVITRHGGRVWATSTPGAGASFFFTLPSSSAPPAAEGGEG